ncbi:MAG TPA: ADOP family duplicated permease [Opitutaceae bacterium]
MLTDLALAFRTWLKSPRLTVALLACIAISVGGASTVLTFVHSLLLRPLPFPDAERLVLLEPNRDRTMGGRAYLSYPNFADLRDSARSFELLEGATVTRLVALTPGGAERLRGETVTPGYFRALGLQPLLGRWFTEDEFAGRGDQAIVLSHRLWTTRYAADATLVGQTIRTRNGPMVLVGVTPQHFIGLAEDEGTDYWLAEKQHVHPTMHTDRAGSTTLVFGRLTPGTNRGQAEAEVRGILSQLVQAHPEANRGLDASLIPLGDKWRAQFRPGLLMMLVGSLFLLVIGCGNVAILLLARLVTRERELAVRLALGAGRRQLLRLMFAESAALALAGGGLGILLAMWLSDMFTRVAGSALPAQMSVTFGAGPLALCLLVVGFTGMCFGLLPALLASRLNAASALRAGGRGLAAGALQGRSGRLLVIGQTALAVSLLAGAALFLRSYEKLRFADFGYRTEGLLRYQISAQRDSYATAEAQETFFRSIDIELRALPGVRNIGYMSPTVPPYDANETAISLKGGDFGTAAGTLEVNQRFTTNEVLEILRVPLRAGRMFGPEDRHGGRAVALVSESLARRIDPAGDALGGTIVFENTEVVVVGVVADARWNGQRDRNPSGHDLFLSMTQFPQVSRGALFDTTVDPRSLIDPVRRAVVARDATVALHWIDTMEQALDFQTSDERFWTVLASTYGATAFLLAVIGLYGVLSHGVASRTCEIGLRMALGANAAGIVRMVVRQGVGIVATGLVAGMILALLSGRYIESKLYGVSARDPVALGAVAIALLAVAVLACLLPARRAAGVNPIEALRAE